MAIVGASAILRCVVITVVLVIAGIPTSAVVADAAVLAHPQAQRANLAYEMCTTTGAKSRCIEEVEINGRPVSDVRSTYDSRPNVSPVSIGPFVQIPNYGESATCRTCTYTDLLQIRILDTGNLSIDVWGVSIGRVAPTPEHPAFVYSSPSVKIDPNIKIRLIVNFGDVNASRAVSRNPVQEYSLTRNEKNDVIVTLTTQSTETASLNAVQGKLGDDYLEACTAPGARADVTDSGVHVQVSVESPWSDEAVPGTIISNNYGCQRVPTIGWETDRAQWLLLPRKTRGKPTRTFVIRTSAPHLRADGSQNTGFFQAVLPPQTILQLGLSVEEVLNGSLDLTVGYGTDARQAVPIEVSLDNRGFIVLRTTQDFHYSSPVLRLSRSVSLRTGTQEVAISTSMSTIKRGVAPQEAIRFPGVRIGKAYVYAIDSRLRQILFDVVKINNGIAKISKSLPKNLARGKGTLLISVSGNRTLARSSLTKSVNIG
jgi:hypothetical protein